MNHRAYIGLWIHAIADFQPARLGNAGVQKLRVQRLMNIAALHREASLPGVDEGAPNRGTGSDLDISILQHQHRILAAEFEHHGQEPCGRALRDALAGWDAAGKDELVDVRRKQRGPRRSVTHHHLKDVLGNSSRVQHRLELQPHEGGEF